MLTGVNTNRNAYVRKIAKGYAVKKTTCIMIRIAPDEKSAAEAAALSRGTTISEMIRAYLARVAKKHVGQA